jgi:hypothetical protein
MHGQQNIKKEESLVIFQSHKGTQAVKFWQHCFEAGGYWTHCQI